MTPEERALEALNDGWLEVKLDLSCDTVQRVASALRSAVEAEREACAKRLDEEASYCRRTGMPGAAVACENVAKFIRSRGSSPPVPASPAKGESK